MVAIQGVAHFSIPVSDIAKSTRFYTEIVGCRHLATVQRRNLAFEKSPKRVRVIVADMTVADAFEPGLLFETGYRPVYYFPRRDVRMDLLERTDHRTHCPHKGDASYWTIRIGDRRVENAVWSYEQPLPEI